MKNNLKKVKSNKTGRVIGTILMVIGAGAVIGFFSSKRNRTKSQEKAKELGNYLLAKVEDEKYILTNKAKDLISKTREVGKDIDGLLYNIEKKTV